MIDNGNTMRDQNNLKLGFVFILLCTYLIWDFVRPADLFPPIKYLRLSLLLTILLLFPILSKVLTKQLFRDPLPKLIVAMFLFAAISLIWVDNRGYWMTCFKGMSLIIIIEFMGIAVLLDSTKKLKTITNLLILAHVFIAVYGVLNLGRGPGNFLTDENDLALALVCVLPMAYFMAKTTGISKVHQWFYVISCLVMFFGIIATNSRGGFLALISAVGVSFLLSPHKKKLIAVLSISGLLLLPFISEQFIAEMQTINDTSDATADGRLWSWKLALDMYKDNPIAGVGMCNYRWNVGEYERAGIGGKWGEMRSSLVGRVAHSNYFTILAELGLIGIVLTFLIIRAYFKSLRPTTEVVDGQEPDGDFHRQLSAALIAGMVGYLVAGGFITAFYTYPQFWLFCGLAVALKRDSKRYVRSGSAAGLRS